MSGVYGSAASMIRDLVSQYGTGYAVPDDVWIANWNGLATTDDPYVPDSYWANHQRIHQYRGGHNETWGGVTINIDNNYLDGAVVGERLGSAAAHAACAARRSSSPGRPRTVALRIRAFNMLTCGKARKVAAAPRPSRYAATGRDRTYFRSDFRCRGRRGGQAAA